MIHQILFFGVAHARNNSGRTRQRKPARSSGVTSFGRHVFSESNHHADMFARMSVIASHSSRWARRFGGWTSPRMKSVLLRSTSSAKSCIFTSTRPVPVYIQVQDLPRPDVQSWLHPPSSPHVACNHLAHAVSIHTFLAIDPPNLLKTPAVMYRFLGRNSTGSV